MARNSSGVLLGNLNKLRNSSSSFSFSCLSGHPYKLLVSNSMHTLARTSISTASTQTLILPNIHSPSPSQSLSYYSLVSPNFRFLQCRGISLPKALGPRNVLFIWTNVQYYSTLREVVDNRLPAVFYFTAIDCPNSSISIEPNLEALGFKFSQLTIFKVCMSQGGCEASLHRLKVDKSPTFHFYLDGEKVDELASTSSVCLGKALANIYNPSGMRKRRRQPKKDENDKGVELSLLFEAVECRFPAASFPKVMEAVESLPEAEPWSELWWFAKGIFSSQEKRELFSQLPDPDLKHQWLIREFTEN